MVPISLNTVVAKDSHQIIDRVVDGEALLIHLQSGDYFSLNDTGTIVWENIDGSRTVQDLAEIVVAEYEGDRDLIVADVLSLVNRLADEGLVVSH